MRHLAKLAALGLCVFLAACKNNSMEVFVLVDLSESWHNDAVNDRDQRVLEAIGRGITEAAQSKDPPVDVQVRPIGAESLGAEPLCAVTYDPKMVSMNKKNRPAYVIEKESEFKTYIETECPALIVHLPVQGLTRITAAIDAVAQRPKDEKLDRFVIIASDFFEENGAEAVPALADLHDTTFILVYRSFEKVDGQNAEHLRTRMQEWTDKLQAQGAKVKKIPDSGLKGSDIAAMLNQ